MKVVILVNEDAGRGLSDADLRLLVQEAGHTVLDVITDFDADLRVPQKGVGLLVAAGGDGTVATVAAIAARASVPMAILPLGTANNIATGLGLGSDIPPLVARWASARRMPLDLGRARAGGKEWIVVEGIGTGLIPAGIAAADRVLERRAAHPVVEVTKAVEVFRDVLMNLEPAPIAVTVDGRLIGEPLLMLEVLNMPGVGPNLVLAPVNVVLAAPKHRHEVLAYLESRIRGTESRLSLPVYPAHHVRIESCGEMHIDDERVDMSVLGPLEIGVQAGAATLLV